MSDDDQILRRHFIAIATDTYQASGTFATLKVDDEVAAMRRWLAEAQRRITWNLFPLATWGPA